MATYRCPECGASHKDLVPYCRLCGAPIESPITVRNVVADRSVAAERFSPKTLNHFIWFGLAVAVLIVIVAFATGTVHNATLSRWYHKIPFVPETVDDAWVDWTDPDEKMIVELPSYPEPAEADLGATTSSWDLFLGDKHMLVGYTEALDFEPGEGTTESDTTTAFRSAAEALADQQGGRVAQVGDLVKRSGSWSSDVILDGLSLEEGVAYGNIRMVMSDGEIVFVETIDYQRNPEAHKRMRSSLVIVADHPDATIPDVPADGDG